MVVRQSEAVHCLWYNRFNTRILYIFFPSTNKIHKIQKETHLTKLHFYSRSHFSLVHTYIYIYIIRIILVHSCSCRYTHARFSFETFPPRKNTKEYHHPRIAACCLFRWPRDVFGIAHYCSWTQTNFFEMDPLKEII